MPSFRSVVEPVLGTRLTLRIDASTADVARATEAAVLATAERLEALLSRHRPSSPFNRWRLGELTDPPAEVVEVLALAAHWHDRTGGAFNTCLGSVVARWQEAAEQQELPDGVELAELAAAAARLPYRAHDGIVVATGDCRCVDVHAVAKGWVVDRMVDAAMADTGVDAVVVDLGGDLRHARRPGDGSTATVAIEDPFDVADNAPPLTIVCVSDASVATSGGGRRGWRIAGRWYGHLLDPSTGWPLAQRRSATVVAATTADADAIASAAAVLGADRLDVDAAILTVEADSTEVRNRNWRATVVERQ